MTAVLQVPLIMIWGDGLTVCPWLVLIRRGVSEANLRHLVPHELCHVEQMRRDGTLRFWWRYVTDQRAKLEYELEAYRVSIANGLTLWSAAEVMSTQYKFTFSGSQLTNPQLQAMLS